MKTLEQVLWKDTESTDLSDCLEDEINRGLDITCMGMCCKGGGWWGGHQSLLCNTCR